MGSKAAAVAIDDLDLAPDAAVEPVEAKPAQSRADKTRAAILNGAILPTLIKLALPTIAVLVAQTAVNIAEAYYVGFLGTDALAGVAMVFPVFMLMTMMSNGGIGSGVASAVARAVGAGRKDDADALVFHAIVIAIIFGAAFTLGTIRGGPMLYRALGGRSEALGAALQYSNYLFAGAIPVWIVNLQAAALRGSGNVKVPAIVTLVGALVLIPASPLLIFGLGPVPRLGIQGAGIAFALYYCGAMLVLLRYMTTGPRRPDLQIRAAAGPAVPRHPQGRHPDRGQYRADQSDGDPGHRGGRIVRHHGACRLRHFLAARLRDDPAVVRPVHGRADHGRRQCRRRPDRARPPDRMDQQFCWPRAHGIDRARRRVISAALAASVQPRCRSAARRA